MTSSIAPGLASRSVRSSIPPNEIMKKALDREKELGSGYNELKN